MNVLIIEPDKTISQMLKRLLTIHNFNTKILTNFDMHLNKTTILKAQAILKASSNDFARDLKQLSAVRRLSKSTYLIVLDKNLDLQQRMKLIEIGADDVLLYPLRPEELIVKLKSFERRPITKQETTFVDGEFTINLWERKIYKDGRELDLSNKEYELLLFLIKRRDKPISREELGNNVWDFSRPQYSNTIDVHINRLRDKLGNREIIDTIYGFGYKLRKPKPKPYENTLELPVNKKHHKEYPK